MDIVSRLIKFRDYTELSNSQFADKSGIPRPTLSQFLNGRNKRLSDDLASKIHYAFPNLNMLWLMFGEGNMLIDSNIEISEGIMAPSSNNSVAQTPTNQSIGNVLFPELENPVSNPNQKFNAFTIKGEETKKGRAAEVSDVGETLEATVRANPSKMVDRIMVFYTDNSYEEFRPVSRP